MKKHMQMWLLPRQTHGQSKMKRCVIFVLKKNFCKNMATAWDGMIFERLMDF